MNSITFKMMENNFVMSILKNSPIYQTNRFAVAMKVYTYMLMYNHIAKSKETHRITTDYDAVRIDFHHNTTTKTHNVPVKDHFIVKCDIEDFLFNQTMVDRIYKSHSAKQVEPEPLIIKTLPVSYDIYNDKMEPYGYCTQNVTLDFTPTIFVP